MTIHINNNLNAISKDIIFKELRKAGVQFIVSRAEETHTLEIVFPSGDETGKYSLKGGTPERRDEKKCKLMEKVKAEILYLIDFSAEPLAINLSVHLSEKFDYDYTYMASLFSSLEGITIERFVIMHKIERVKDLLASNNLTVTEIATLMHYSSIAHLSSQFKKATGMTTSQFKQANRGDWANITP